MNRLQKLDTKDLLARRAAARATISTRQRAIEQMHEAMDIQEGSLALLKEVLREYEAEIKRRGIEQ